MSNAAKYFIGFAFTLLSWGCPGTQQPETLALAGTNWILTAMPADLPPGIKINLQFDEEKITGKGVCNRYFSNYELTGDQIHFNSIGATEMMCLKYSELERIYLQLLQQSETIRRTKDALTVITKNGTLEFRLAATSGGN